MRCVFTVDPNTHMNTKHAFATVAVAATLIFLGCKKDSGLPGAPATVSLSEVFENNRATGTQQFVVQAGTASQITGAGGVAVYFGPNAFQTMAGAPVFGAVQISLLEVLEPSDMIWYNVQTLGSDGGQMRPLVSGGAIRLTAVQGASELQLVAGAYQVRVPTDQPDPAMGLFVADDMEGDILWDPLDSANLVLDTTAAENWSYAFFGTGFHWTNCDYFMNVAGVQTGVSVGVPSGYSISNTKVWLAFPQSNTVTGLNAFASSAFSTGSYYTLPVGLPVVVVGLHYDGTGFHSGFLSTTVTNGMDVNLGFAPTTQAQFLADCQAL